MTPGADLKTLDGMSLERINSIIEQIRNHNYQPTPVKRIYIPKTNSIPKSNAKQRPLGIPSIDDKLIQEVIRLILESIFEPTFSRQSHGFRPNKSVHTALDYVRKCFTATKWWVEGDIQSFFDSIDHHILINIIRKRIADECFLDLIWKFLRAGYLEKWVYHRTYSGTPQGSIISPILANMFLNELDQYMIQYAEQFNQGKRRNYNPKYVEKHHEYQRMRNTYQRNKPNLSYEQKRSAISEIKAKRRELKTLSSVDPMDSQYKRFFYVRFAADFLVGVIGSKAEAEQIKGDIGVFLGQKLKLTLSAEKTLVTHGQDMVRFVGYDLAVFRGQCNKRTKVGCTKRVNNGRIMLFVPFDKMVKRLISYKALKFVNNTQKGYDTIWEPMCRCSMMYLEDLEILNQYNAEIRGLYNFYRLANNVFVLNNFSYVMKFSLFKTFAGKYRSSVRKIISRYRVGKDFVVSYPTKSGKGEAVFYNEGFCRDTRVRAVDPDIVARVVENYSTLTFYSLRSLYL
jgi:group II intron reverse transcriptase/maturase